MGLKFISSGIKIAMNGRFFECAVHAFDLPICPGVVGFGEPMFNAIGHTNPVEQMSKRTGLVRQVRELDTVVGQDDVNAIGNMCDECLEEGNRVHPRRPWIQPSKGELGGAVNGDEQRAFSFGGRDLRNVDVKEADGILLELLPFWLVSLHIWQTTNPMTLQTAMQ